MNQFLTMKSAKLMAYVINVSFLLIHVAMIAVFGYYGVTPMVYFNVFSLLFYACGFYVVYREWLRVYCELVYLEVVCHMVLAAYFTGWENGFQVTLIGMSVLLFFAEYMGHSLQIQHVRALPMCALGMCMYLGTLVAGVYFPAQYVLPDAVTFWLQFGWGVIVFVVSAAVLQVFITATFNSEEVMTTRLEHDRLTGLPNRDHMAHYLSDLMGESGLSGYWAAMADLDDFKVVNDTYGHTSGDTVLRELAAVFRENLADIEVCRWGGEEFLLVGRMEGDSEVLRARLDRIRKVIEGRPLWLGEERLNVTITMGAAEYAEGDTVIEWINKADKKLYAGKASGKNTVVV